MIFHDTRFEGLRLIELEPITDERGFFARTFCQNEFAQHGLPTDVLQCNHSYNRLAGTIRGMHFQRPPSEEGKLVRCTRGSLYDVVVDIRDSSGARGEWEAFELSAANHRMLYIPPGFAHGFQTLEDDTEVLYQMTAFFEPALAEGVRWNDPVLGIRWPLPPTVVSEKDRSYRDFSA
jgi:dTDP-4-dehydrorhamnose 3,5-epimerase